MRTSALFLALSLAGCTPGKGTDPSTPGPTADDGGTRALPDGGQATNPDGGPPVVVPGTDASFQGKVYDERILAAASSYTKADLVRKTYIFFGHQSVGNNILDGLEALGNADAKYKIERKWLQPDEVSVPASPAIVDKEIGRNEEPDTKFAAFTQIVNSSTVSSKIRIALMKLCFVDFSINTDAHALAQRYVSTIQALEQKHPGIIFVYATAPLGVGDQADVQRNAYNARVRALAASRPLFDIASIEASRDGQARCTSNVNGPTLDRLCDEYDNDGDPHLNSVGAQRVAKAMALMFADLLKTH